MCCKLYASECFKSTPVKGRLHADIAKDICVVYCDIKEKLISQP